MVKYEPPTKFHMIPHNLPNYFFIIVQLKKKKKGKKILAYSYLFKLTNHTK
jgi:hypothetical protein